nr:MAG TPA: High affinity nerve growth factor receptor, TRANSFERASE [Caudoviricetes sp.]
MKNNITSYMVHIVMGVIIVVLLGLVGLIVINVK